ncbi:hypothetical protein Tco_1578094 [Tanacetum coccineum]
MEKTAGNAEFHAVIDFLMRSSIHNALTDEGSTSERPSEPQPTPSPPHPSEATIEPQTDPSPRPSAFTHIPDSIPESSGRNHGGHSSSDKSLSGNEGDMTLQSVYDLCNSLCIQSLDEECLLEAKISRKEILEEKLDTKGVCIQTRKSAKAKPSVHKDPLFDELPDDMLDYIDTKDAQDVVDEEKESAKDAVSTEGVVSTDKEKVSTDKPNVSTDIPKVNTDKEKDSTISPDEGTDDQTEGTSATPTTPTTTHTKLEDDETHCLQVLLNMSQAKALKPLPKIDLKDKGKKKIEEEDESDTESEEEERKRLAEKEATNAALIQDFDDIKARMEDDRLLALRLQEEERERAVHSIAIRNKPPIRTQLRNQMMTYLKHVGNKKHSDLKNKTFEEIQALYEKVKRIKKKVDRETPKKEDTTKVPTKVDVTEQGTKKRKGGHIKMLARKRKRPQSDVVSNDEHMKCLKIVTFEGTMDSEIMERKSVIARLNKVTSPDGDYLVIYRANGNFRAFNYRLEIVTWRLYEACGVYILELKDGTVIHMLVERRYPLSKDLLQRMLDLGLEVERESTVALDLIRFIKQQIDEN